MWQAYSIDCDAYPDPLQVMREDDDEPYVVAQLDLDTGNYDEIFDLAWFDGHVNAVAMGVRKGADHYLVAAFTAGGVPRLCTFDAAKYECFGVLEIEKPNVGAVLRDEDGREHYYYAKDIGRDGEKGVYYVQSLYVPGVGHRPTFHSDINFVVSEALYERSVLDFVAVHEVRTTPRGSRATSPTPSSGARSPP